jgi:hypothetical protein
MSTILSVQFGKLKRGGKGGQFPLSRDGYRIELTSSDGVRGVVDLANRIVGRGGVFAPLENPEFFRQVALDNELGTLAWPNGADFCPDLLYDWVTGKAVSPPETESVAAS